MSLNIAAEEGRFLLENCAAVLRSGDTPCSIALSGDGEAQLLVPVNTPSGKNARFSISVSPDGGSALLNTMFVSDVLQEGLTAVYSLHENDTADEICEDLILPFTEECFREEMQKIVEISFVNDDTLEEFAPYLDDRALSVENIYALGIRVLDGDSIETAGAASFGFTADALILENLELRPEYTGFGIEEYVGLMLDRIAAEAEQKE